MPWKSICRHSAPRMGNSHEKVAMPRFKKFLFRSIARRISPNSQNSSHTTQKGSGPNTCDAKIQKSKNIEISRFWSIFSLFQKNFRFLMTFRFFFIFGFFFIFFQILIFFPPKNILMMYAVQIRGTEGLPQGQIQICDFYKAKRRFS